MPFSKFTDIDTVEKYKQLFKAEAKRLMGAPEEFFFCPDLPIGPKKAKVPVLVFGKVKKPVIDAIRTQGSSFAYGQCAKTKTGLELEIVKGKINPKKLNEAAKGTGFSCSIVDALTTIDALTPQRSKTGDKATDDQAHDDEQRRVRVERNLYACTEAFTAIKAGLTGTQRETLRAEFDKVQTTVASKDYATADGQIKSLGKSIADARAVALSATNQQVSSRKGELEQVAKEILRSNGEVEKHQAIVARLARELKEHQEQYTSMKKGNAKADRKIATIATWKTDLEAADLKAKEISADMGAKIAKLKAQQQALPKQIEAAMINLNNKLETLTNSSKTANEFRSKLERLVGEQSEAMEWQKEQLDGSGHGANRHGAQTGIERQARRAATERGVTPDQPGNEAGTTQVSRENTGEKTTKGRTKWLDVTIEYEEETTTSGKLKRTIKNKNKITGDLVNRARERTGGGGGKTSIWASPVLEKEAVTRALKFANSMKKWKTWNNGADHSFLNLGVFIGKPKSAPGWGYGLEKSGDGIAESDADKILTDFENGKKNLNDLLSGLNVKLVTSNLSDKDKEGVKMIPNATIVFKRTNTSADWKLVTHYPNNDLDTAKLGFEFEQGVRPETVSLSDGSTTKSMSTKTNL